MTHPLESCLDRETLGTGETAICHVLRRTMGLQDIRPCIVPRDVCRACCRSLPGPGQVNPVIASRIYAAARHIQEIGGQPDCSIPRAEALERFAADHLHTILSDVETKFFPPMRSPVDGPRATGVSHALRWAVAMLTAPRKVPTIEQSLASLRRAGFHEVRLFAEPDSVLPDDRRDLEITRHPVRLGNLLNFYSSLATLCEERPDADAFAVFQDDIAVATGLQEWCETELWPHGHGLVSLFTPHLHEDRQVGWRILSPGMQRVCGAQAIVFRRDMLERFLSDPHVVRELRLRRWGDDAVLGAWVKHRGLGIAYHTPSPVQHVGVVSSLYPDGPDRRNVADAVSHVTQMATWTWKPRVATIGLVGWNTRTGLGSMNRDLARHLGIKHWLVPPHPTLETLRAEGPRGVEITTGTTPRAVGQWVAQLDWLVFAERPYVDELPRYAAHAGVGIACIPMWEWIRPDDPWLEFVDVMICPTRYTERLMRDWALRYGYGWQTVHMPWPIDAQRFPMRERQVCREFLFVNGWGGGNACFLDGSPFPYSRKGLELIIEAARLAPDLKFIVRSLSGLPSTLPRNIRIAPATEDNAELYDLGDVCVQPSHYEGLGLQLLECQAAGMPLVTTAAPPMDEANPWRLVPTRGEEIVNLWGSFFGAASIAPEDLVDTLRPLVGLNLREASWSARTYVETEHRWDTARSFLLDQLCKRA